MTIQVGGALSFDDVLAVGVDREPVALAEEARAKIDGARRVIEGAVAADTTMYGVTTGFGGLSNVRIPASEAEKLQADIIRSHATAVGPPLPPEVVRAMLLLRARTFAAGISGVRVAVVDTIIAMLNAGVLPVVPQQGSLGASGDLALLAHLALPLIGEGEVTYENQRRPAAEALAEAGVEPLTLSYKEGLSLVNGTEAMLALGILACSRAEQLAHTADLAGAMTTEACLGTDRAFDADLVALRAHKGAVAVAANLRTLLAGSGIVASHRDSDHLVQDAYSIRCMPQVHGAYRDGIAYVRSVLEAELASAIDNPSILVERGEVLSGGNFHGESLALALDHLGLCVTGFGTISERRVARLVDPELNNGLPAFLTSDPGRRSGFMLASYTAASLVSENRSLCFPASADSVSTSAGQEDHVSMGMTSARRAEQILTNAELVIAIELLAAAQGIELRAPLAPAPATAAALAGIRRISPHLDEDRPLSGEIEATAEALRKKTFLDASGAAMAG